MLQPRAVHRFYHLPFVVSLLPRKNYDYCCIRSKKPWNPAVLDTLSNWSTFFPISLYTGRIYDRIFRDLHTLENYAGKDAKMQRCKLDLIFNSSDIFNVFKRFVESKSVRTGTSIVHRASVIYQTSTFLN